MTTVAMNNLWNYIQGLSLSAKNQAWLAARLTEASKQSKPKTKKKSVKLEKKISKVDKKIPEPEEKISDAEKLLDEKIDDIASTTLTPEELEFLNQKRDSR